ncbi:BnaC03g15330D [Brassica napus]|uniref:BnaC03g15330D protein n=1 Tax=Brassica napus TaxID=3708 RepID=A0A078HM89_BRANA|nr:BnaC03g15330D [Brassica napus]
MYSRSPTTQWKKDAGNQTDDTDSEPQMSYEGRINSLSLKDNPLSLMPQMRNLLKML